MSCNILSHLLIAYSDGYKIFSILNDTQSPPPNKSALIPSGNFSEFIGEDFIRIINHNNQYIFLGFGHILELPDSSNKRKGIMYIHISELCIEAIQDSTWIDQIYEILENTYQKVVDCQSYKESIEQIAFSFSQKNKTQIFEYLDKFKKELKKFSNVIPKQIIYEPLANYIIQLSKNKKQWNVLQNKKFGDDYYIDHYFDTNSLKIATSIGKKVSKKQNNNYNHKRFYYIFCGIFIFLSLLCTSLLQQEHNKLNERNIALQQDYNKLQQDYNKLQQDYNKLQQDYNKLQQEHNKLNEICNKLQQGGKK